MTFDSMAATTAPIVAPWRRLARRMAAALLAAALGAAVSACAPRAAGSAGAPGVDGPPSVLSRDAAAPSTQAGVVAAGALGAVQPGGRALVALLAPIGAAQPAVADIGRALEQAARLAERDVADPTLELRVYDTAGDPGRAQAAAQQAVADGASIILGPLFAQSVRAAAPVAAAGGVNLIAFSTDPSVAGGNVFLLSFLTADEIDRVVAFAAQRGLRRFGAVAPTSALGEVGLAALRQSTARQGGAVVATSRYEPTFQGIEAGVRNYAEAHAAESAVEPVQAVLLADQGQALQSVAAYLAYFDVSPRQTKFFGPGTWNDPSTLKEIALEGGWFAGPDPRLTSQFAERFEAAYGARPHRLASLAYDAVAAAGALLDEARTRGEVYPFSAAAIADPAGFAGANGLYRFRPDGLNERGLAVFEVRSGTFAVIDSAPTTFAGF